MFQIINTTSHIAEIQDDLQEVYQSQVSFGFYSPSYVISSYEHFLASTSANALFFVIYKVKNQITHYIPWYIDPKGTLRFIFDRHTDYCSFVGTPLTFQMYKELTQLIAANKDIKKIELENLLPDDQLLNHFRHFLGSGTAISCYNNHSFVSNFKEGFLSHLRSTEKSKLNRLQRKNEGFTFEVFSGEKPFPALALEKLRAEMIASKSREVDFFDAGFLHLSEALYKAGELEVFSKWNNGRLISASMVLKNKSYRMVWIDLYADVQFINLSAYIDYIQYLEQFPKTTFSFGRGSYDYKAKNFQPTLQNLYNLRYSKSKWDFFFVNFYPIKLFIKRLVKEKK